MTRLHDKLVRHITRFGPITVAEFMTFALLDPDHGYYTTHNPIGAEGDFITAPEISQMFGELIGLWLAQTWLDQGAPPAFTLAELGPGRGTLMQDILRATKRVPKFHDAMQVVLVEASPSLRKVQKSALANIPINWVDTIASLPERPTYIVANEFFDCLPIHQFRRSETGWQEQMVALNGDQLGFILGKDMPLDVHTTGDFSEHSNAATALMAQIDQLIATQGGAALIIDYGENGSTGDTLQALWNHTKVDPLSHIGKADLTAHVDFAALSRAVDHCEIMPLTTQGAFLERLGITQRAQALANILTGEALENHIQAHRRLTHPEQMGTLFKVFGIHPKGTPPLIGFDQ